MPVVMLVSVLALALGLINLIAGSADSAEGETAVVTLGAAGGGGERPIPGSFLGLSIEYSALRAYAGSDPAAIDPVFVQLARNLSPGQPLQLRIGGDSSDWTWWPVAGIARPPGVTYALDANWLAVTRALTRALDARLLLALNLEADDTRLAAAELEALRGGSQPGSVRAFELGNEPELYGLFPWYRAGGRGVPGRPPTYGFSTFLADFTRFAGSLPAAPLAGPTSGGTGWIPFIGHFLASEPRVSLVTVHRYPLQLCFTRPGSPRFPSVAHLLAPAASSGLAASFGPEVAAARARGLPLRVDELNTVSCGADPAVSRTFASALWALDTLFELARVGVKGVDMHTFPGAGYELFGLHRSGSRWRATVSPEYYGLLMFALAAPAGSGLVPIAGAPAGPVKVWATRAPDRRIRVVLINKDTSAAHRVEIRGAASSGSASLERLLAPSAVASSGVTLGGQSFGAGSETGRLAGPRSVSSLSPTGGTFAVSLPAASAALVTLPPAR